MSNLLCIDPGGTTGVSVITYSETSEPKLEYYTQIDGGLDGFIDFYRSMKNICDWNEIVCESFTLRTGVKFPDLTPVYIIGALEALVKKQLPITYQPPTSKPLCNDDALKRINFYKPGKGHANDSTRHGIIYLRNNKHMPTIKMVWPKED